MNVEHLTFDRIYEESEHILGTLNNSNSNFIFGCGWMGTKFYETIKNWGIVVDGFVVTNKKQEKYLGLPVYSLDEMRKDTFAKNVFVALRDQDEELNRTLGEFFQVVYPITYPNHITVIESRYYIDYLKEKKIDFSKEKIDLNGFIFDNPFIDSYDYLLSWVYEAGDLILPGIYDDYHRIDEGPYERPNTKLEQGDVVLDCGANIGLFTTVAAQKGCQVYAFEPMPIAISYLEKLKKQYNEQIHICPYALADKEGQAKFHVQNFDLLGASLLENNNVIDCDYDVDVTTVDEFVRKNQLTRVDYIKADIEGSERDMLKGAEETIRRFTPKISVCTYHLEDDKEVLETRIKSICPDYVVEHQWKKLYAYVPKE